MKIFIEFALIFSSLIFFEKTAFAQRYPSAGSPSVGIVGASIPGYGDFVGAKDPSGNLAAMRVDSSGNLLMSGSVTQGGAPWAQNLTQLSGSAFSAGNSLPARITNGSVFVDPTQIRPLTSADVVSAAQSGSWSVNVSNQITGFATAANQTTANGYLGAITSQLPASLGAKLSSGSLSVVFATDAPGLPVSGTVTANQGSAGASAWKVDGSSVTQPISAAALPLPSGAATSALQTTGNSSLSSLDTKTPSLGQAAMAASRPVVIASNQSAIPVTTGIAAAVTVNSASISVGTTAVRLTTNGTAPASTRRKLVFVASTGNTGNCYFGSSTVTTTTGIYAFPGAITTYDLDLNDYFAICDTASQTFLVMEDK